MPSKDSSPIYLVHKTPSDNKNRYSFTYIVNSISNPRRIVLQHRNSKKDGGGYIGSIGGKYGIYQAVDGLPIQLHEFDEIGMLKELYQETGLKPDRYVHRGHYWWTNEKQGYCEGEAYFVEVRNLPRHFRRLKEGRPVNLDATKVVSHQNLLRMQRLILSELLYSQRFFCEEIPFEETLW